MPNQLSILLLMAALPVAAQANSWKTDIDNSLVHVSRRLVGAHETVSAAEMRSGLFVLLTDHSVRVTTAALQEERRGAPGQFFWHPGGRISLENLSDHAMEVALVAPKFSPASEPAPAVLNGRSVVFENDLIRVRHVSGAAVRRTAERPLPSLVIQLSAAHFRLTYTDGRVEEFRVKAGDIRFEAAGGLYLHEQTEAGAGAALRVV